MKPYNIYNVNSDGPETIPGHSFQAICWVFEEFTVQHKLEDKKFWETCNLETQKAVLGGYDDWGK